MEDGKGRNQEAYLDNEGTQQMIVEYKAPGSMEEFRKFKMPALELTLDAARVVAMHKAQTLGHNPSVMVSNRQGSKTVVHDGDENGKVTQKGDNALASWDRLDFRNRDYCNQVCEHDWGHSTRINLAYTVRTTALASTWRTRCAAARHNMC